jgi:hypothetical protein
VSHKKRRCCENAFPDSALPAEAQVLDDQALTAADGGGEGGEDEPDEFEHRGRIADQDSRQDRRTTLPPTGSERPQTAEDGVEMKPRL